MLDRSPIFNDVLKGHTLKVNYIVNGRDYDMSLMTYIFHGFAFANSIFSPHIRQHKFAQYQKTIRKDVEQTFGVL